MSVQGSNPSRSPSRGLRQSFSEQISDIKTKLSRALSSERPNLNHDGSIQYSQLEDTKVADRSLSRGRESFGRGGLGNMRPSSTSRGPDNREMSLERGRGANRIVPSDDIDSVPEVTNRLHSPGHSTGRGGYANITDLRSPDIEPPIHVTHPEHERVSTGRGGVGNIRDRSNSKVRDQPEPHIHHPIAEENFYSSGRGGAGNIRSRSQSKPPKDEKSHHHDHKLGVEKVIHKVIHPNPHA